MRERALIDVVVKFDKNGRAKNQPFVAAHHCRRAAADIKKIWLWKSKPPLSCVIILFCSQCVVLCSVGSRISCQKKCPKVQVQVRHHDWWLRKVSEEGKLPNGRKPTLWPWPFLYPLLFSQEVLDIRYIGTWTSLVLPRPSKRATLSVITEISEDSFGEEGRNNRNPNESCWRRQNPHDRRQANRKPLCWN